MTNQPLPYPEHWHLKFGDSDAIFGTGVEAGSAFLDFCDNMFVGDLDREEAEAKLAFYMSTQPFLTIHMSRGSWPLLCVPCAGCKKRSLN